MEISFSIALIHGLYGPLRLSKVLPGVFEVPYILFILLLVFAQGILPPFNELQVQPLSPFSGCAIWLYLL